MCLRNREKAVLRETHDKIRSVRRDQVLHGYVDSGKGVDLILNVLENH